MLSPLSKVHLFFTGNPIFLSKFRMFVSENLKFGNFWTNLSGPIAGLALLEKESNSAVGEHTLLHREALLVVATADAHHVALRIVRFQHCAL